MIYSVLTRIIWAGRPNIMTVWLTLHVAQMKSPDYASDTFISPLWLRRGTGWLLEDDTGCPGSGLAACTASFTVFVIVSARPTIKSKEGMNI